jgi:hypothetical protein
MEESGIIFLRMICFILRAVFFPTYPFIYWQKLLYVLGVLFALEPTYEFRLHWFLLWMAYLFYLQRYARYQFKLSFDFFVFSGNLFIFSFFGFLILISQIQVFHFRFLIPVFFVLIGVVFSRLPGNKNPVESFKEFE